MAAFIAGDWGSTHLRLWLCDEARRVLDHRIGPGALGPHEPYETILLSLIEPWLAAHGPLPVRLCGMVGSRNGWVEAPYAPCPAGANDIARLMVRFEALGVSISIAPGVVGQTQRGTPDVMRGEETQILGAIARRPELAEGRRLVAHPGTHTKWALLEAGRIVNFQTAMTGEMFALIRDHSAIAKVGGGVPGGGAGGFAEGVRRYRQAGGVGLLHLLFEARSRQLVDGWDPAFALEFVSGLLVCADVDGAAAQFGDTAREVVLIGDPALNARYAEALAGRGARSVSMNGEDCALAGLARLAQAAKELGHVG